MRKIFAACIALVLGIAAVLPATLPVAAAPTLVGMAVTERNVTEWQADSVYWGTTHVFVNLMVQKYSDGTIVGHVDAGPAQANNTAKSIKFQSADFNSNMAIIVCQLQYTNGSTTWFRFTLIDNGQPAIGNSKINIEVEVGPSVWYSIFTPQTTPPTPSKPLASGAVLLINNAVIQVRTWN